MSSSLKKKIYAWIFARSGSKGFPGKNIKMLCGKPLIAWAVEAAKRSTRIERVFVSTDSKEIAEVAQKYHAEIPFLRPSELARDDSPEWLAWKHAVAWVKQQGHLSQMDLMVSVPPTSPVRQPAHIDACIDMYLKGGADTVIAVAPSNRHPAFNMVTINGKGYVELVMPPPERVHCRQELPRIYNIIPVAYVTSPEFVLKADSYMEGRVKAVILPEKCGVDIDSEIDFRLAEVLLTMDKKGELALPICES